MTQPNTSARREALRSIALQKLGLGTESREYNLLRILNLAQRAFAYEGARFSILEEGELCMIAETEGAVGCQVEHAEPVRSAMERDEHYFNHDLQLAPLPALTEARIQSAPLRSVWVMPVYSPDRQPIGVFTLMGSSAHSPAEDGQESKLLNDYVRLIEDSLLLRALSVRDPLTSLYNRRFFEDQARVEWRRAMRLQVPLTFALLDVDYFKQYNDSVGHDAGDDVLVKLGQIITDACHRPGDIACRFGGEEFVLLLPMTPAEGAMTLLNRIRTQLEDSAIDHPAIDGVVTLSAGISTAKTSEELEAGSIDSFLKDADTALYAAKKAGRNCIRHFHDGTG